MSDSSRSPSPRKSASPAPRPSRRKKKFPLSIHKGTQYWCKKIRGHVYYFGKVADDPEGVAALAKYNDEREDLEAGREPRAKAAAGALTVDDLNIAFLDEKQQKKKEGRCSVRTFEAYRRVAKTLAEVVGGNRAVVDLTPDDFRKLRAHFSKTQKIVALRNSMQAVRSIYKFGYEEGKLKDPIRFGKGFDLPSKEEFKIAKGKHEAAHGKRMIEADEIRQLLDGRPSADDEGNPVLDGNGRVISIAGASQPMRAMILLGANCAFGQTDLGRLPLSCVNLETGWVEFPRPKTGELRRCPLWPETVAAIRDWLPKRPKAKDPDDSGLLFLTETGRRFVRVGDGGASIDRIVKDFSKLIEAHDLKRERLGFYALRHGFRTIADEVADYPAIDRIMGHKDNTMGGRYRERLENEDARLRRVVEHVRAWLFPPKKETCDPCDPCDPRSENPVKTQGNAGRTAKKGTAPRATRSDPQSEFRAAGTHGTQDSGSSSPDSDSGPFLRLFAG